MRIGVKPSKLALKTKSMCYGEMIGVASLSSISNTNIKERCCWCTMFQTNLALCRQILWTGKHRGFFFFFCFRDNVVSTGVCGWWNAVCISRHKWSLREIKFGIISTINTRIYRTPTIKYECGPTTYVKRIILLVSPSHLGQLDFNDRLRAHASHTHIRNK